MDEGGIDMEMCMGAINMFQSLPSRIVPMLSVISPPTTQINMFSISIDAKHLKIKSFFVAFVELPSHGF